MDDAKGPDRSREGARRSAGDSESVSDLGEPSGSSQEMLEDPSTWNMNPAVFGEVITSLIRESRRAMSERQLIEEWEENPNAVTKEWLAGMVEVKEVKRLACRAELMKANKNVGDLLRERSTAHTKCKAVVSTLQFEKKRLETELEACREEVQSRAKEADDCEVYARKLRLDCGRDQKLINELREEIVRLQRGRGSVQRGDEAGTGQRDSEAEAFGTPYSSLQEELEAQGSPMKGGPGPSGQRPGGAFVAEGPRKARGKQNHVQEQVRTGAWSSPEEETCGGKDSPLTEGFRRGPDRQRGGWGQDPRTEEEWRNPPGPQALANSTVRNGDAGPPEGMSVRRPGQVTFQANTPRGPEPLGLTRGPWLADSAEQSSYQAGGRSVEETFVRGVIKEMKAFPKFEPKAGEVNNTSNFLQVLTYALERGPELSVADKTHVLRMVSSVDVQNFINRQLPEIQMDFDRLLEAIRNQWPDSPVEAGLGQAMGVKQGRYEHPDSYLQRLREAFFGARNDPGMEEDQHFKALFLLNMHSATRGPMGTMANPRVQRLTELRNHAICAYSLAPKKGPGGDSQVFALAKSDLQLEGGGEWSPPEEHQREAGRGRGRRQRSGPSGRGNWDHPGREHSPRGWRSEGRDYSPRRRGRAYSPRRGREYSPRKGGWDYSPRRGGRNYSPRKGGRDYSPRKGGRGYSPRRNRDWRVRDCSPEPRRRWNREETPPRGRRERKERSPEGRRGQRARNGSSKPRREWSPRNKGNRRGRESSPSPEPPDLPDKWSLGKESWGEEKKGYSDEEEGRQDEKAPPAEKGGQAKDRKGGPERKDPKGDKGDKGAAVLAIHRASPGELPQEPYEEAESEEDRGFRQLVGRLELRGPDRKAFLPVVMEGVLEVEAMLDTAAGVTLMSQGLFQRLRAQAERAGKRLNTAPCTVSLQPYAEGKTVVENVAVVELSMGPVSMAHPVYVSPIAAPELLIGQDCLLRLDPLMDFKRLELWMQTRRPKPVECWPEGAHVTEVGVELAPPIEACQSFLCAVSSLAKDDFPKVLGPVVVGGTAIDGVGLALWADRSAINQGILEAVQANRPGGVFTPRVVQYRDASRGPCQGIGLWSAKVVWSGRTLRHTFVVVRGLAYPLQVGCDLLVKMGVVVDSINNVLWALTWPEEGSQEVESDSVKSDQVVPQAGLLITSSEVQVLGRGSAVMAVRVKPGQAVSASQAFFQALPSFNKRGLCLRATPLVKLTDQTTEVEVFNAGSKSLTVAEGTAVGWAIGTDFCDFDLNIPVVGGWPKCLPPGKEKDGFYTVPRRAILLHGVLGENQGVCRVDRTKGEVMVVQVVSQEASLTATTGEATKVEVEIDRVVSQADAATTEEQRRQLREVLLKYREFMSLDSSDCGLTDLHVMKVPTQAGAPPTYVRQYNIPLASHGPVQEIIDDLLEKDIIRPCNSTYSAPIWPVRKPNGKWRLTIDYRKLNKTMPLSRWPMARVQQDLARAREAQLFSTLDVASGFWTIPVAPEDQHKLAFTFANRQYTFKRCPFGLANSPAEFNIFLHKACPDAAERGNVIYVDDILIRSRTFPQHLEEIEHVLGQLTGAGAKISLLKCQWCKKEVDYVGLTVTPEGVKPQASRVQGLEKLVAPCTLKEVRSFLGVCNYSRQFIEGYAELARPLTQLLKKGVPFEWGPEQEEAWRRMKECLGQAPCLVLPEMGQPFYLEVGFSETCLSAGLYQVHDGNKRVVAYASKAMAGPELKYSDCEKALLATVWAVQHFGNYLGGQKVVVNTNHQPITLLTSQKLRDGVVTQARIASWIMGLQSFDIEVKYSQRRRAQLGGDLARCQECSSSGDRPVEHLEGLDSEAGTSGSVGRHHLYDQDACRGMARAYVDGCSYHHEEVVHAGAAVVWLGDDPFDGSSFQLGEKTSQFAEMAAVLIAMRMAAVAGLEKWVLCTDSEYCYLGFTSHLPVWKEKGFSTQSGKSLAHQGMIEECVRLCDNHNMQVYWKKVKGHSREPGPDKEYNDRADELAKGGALGGVPWEFVGGEDPDKGETRPASVMVVTRAQKKEESSNEAGLSQKEEVSTAVHDDLVALQKADPTLGKVLSFVNGKGRQAPLSKEDRRSDKELKKFYRIRAKLEVRHGLLVFVPDKHRPPALVVPRALRGVFLVHAHDAAAAGHRGVSATLQYLQQVAYWPRMQDDVKDYVKGCLVCCQFQPSRALHRAPLQRQGISFPWSHLQIDWVGPLPKSSRGNKYILMLTCRFTKWVEGLPAPNDTAQTTAALLMNHVFSRFGLPSQVDSDRGTHFTAEVMGALWRDLGVKARFHVSHHPQSSGQVERANRTMLEILRKYVGANQRDWDVKLPLVLMAIRATPHESTGVSPFELMTGRQMTLPLHLLYQPGEASVATAYTAESYMAELRDHLGAAFAFAQEKLAASVEGRKAYYDKKASDKEVDVGEEVWYYNFVRPAPGRGPKLAKKFLPRWSGPYRVVNKLSPVAYQIRVTKEKKGAVLKWVHRNQIKPHKAFMGLKQGQADVDNV